jgi:CMP/dCMP kinase
LNFRYNIAIDGFSSCGKSTLAKALAKRLRLRYIDTGAMYRAIALFACREGLLDENNQPDELRLKKRLNDIDVDFVFNPVTQTSEVYLNGEPIETHIRNLEIGSLASEVSKFRSVRDKLQSLQKQIASAKGVIMDGRDIGTVVIPDAELKLFMTADPEIRATRRYLELKEKGKDVTLEAVKIQQAKRDYQDVNREEDPLKQAEDAIVFDNSDMSEEEQLQQVIAMLQRVVQEV